MTNSNPAAVQAARDRATALADRELLVAWDGMVCGSPPDRLAHALRLLGREHLAENEEANIQELRHLHEAVWQEIAVRGLVDRTPPDSRYEDDDPADGGSVERHEDMAPVG